MPAKTEKQRKMMAIALHTPSKLHKKNKKVLKMSKSQLRDFSVKKFPQRKTNKSMSGKELLRKALS